MLFQCSSQGHNEGLGTLPCLLSLIVCLTNRRVRFNAMCLYCFWCGAAPEARTPCVARHALFLFVHFQMTPWCQCGGQCWIYVLGCTTRSRSCLQASLCMGSNRCQLAHATAPVQLMRDEYTAGMSVPDKQQAAAAPVGCCCCLLFHHGSTVVWRACCMCV